MLLLLVFGLVESVALCTLVGLVHSVDGAHVRLQVGQLRERRVHTDGAIERPLAGVFAYVHTKNTGVGKRMPADLCDQGGKALNNHRNGSSGYVYIVLVPDTCTADLLRSALSDPDTGCTRTAGIVA